MEDFNKVVEAALEESNIPYAAYALTNSETMLASGSVGFTDLEKKIPLSSDAIFRIASMTKALTSSAFLLLAERENLALHTPVEGILDEFKELKVAKLENDEIHYESPNSKITFHQLLTHTSGFGYDFHHQTLSHLLLQGEIADLLDKEGKFLKSYYKKFNKDLNRWYPADCLINSGKCQYTKLSLFQIKSAKENILRNDTNNYQDK